MNGPPYAPEVDDFMIPSLGPKNCKKANSLVIAVHVIIFFTRNNRKGSYCSVLK